MPSYAENKASIKRYVAKNADAVAEYKRQHYLNNREHILNRVAISNKKRYEAKKLENNKNKTTQPDTTATIIVSFS